MTIATERIRFMGDAKRMDHCVRGLGSRVVLIEYGDFACERSVLASSMVKGIRRHYAKEVAFVFRHYPRIDLHPFAGVAAQACEAADMQGGFWRLHDALFEQPRPLDPDEILRCAADVGLDIRRLRVDASSGVVRSRIERDVGSGRAAGVVSTPTFFIKGARYEGDLAPVGFADAVRGAVRGAVGR
jgi:protein-disulfide isomerase